jgi:hypothetical protein
MVGALALDQGDGARQHRAVAGADRLRQVFDIARDGGHGHAISIGQHAGAVKPAAKMPSKLQHARSCKPRERRHDFRFPARPATHAGTEPTFLAE